MTEPRGILIVIAKAPHVVVEFPKELLSAVGVLGRQRLVFDPDAAREFARELWDKSFHVEEEIFLTNKRRP